MNELRARHSNRKNIFGYPSGPAKAPVYKLHKLKILFAHNFFDLCDKLRYTKTIMLLFIELFNKTNAPRNRFQIDWMLKVFRDTETTLEKNTIWIDDRFFLINNWNSSVHIFYSHGQSQWSGWLVFYRIFILELFLRHVLSHDQTPRKRILIVDAKRNKYFSTESSVAFDL